MGLAVSSYFPSLSIWIPLAAFKHKPLNAGPVSPLNFTKTARSMPFFMRSTAPLVCGEPFGRPQRRPKFRSFLSIFPDEFAQMQKKDGFRISTMRKMSAIKSIEPIFPRNVRGHVFCYLVKALGSGALRPKSFSNRLKQSKKGGMHYG
jgi:hypothetical protein